MNRILRPRAWRCGSAVPILLALTLSACMAPARGATPTLVRLVDGSSNPPTSNGKITFQSVGSPDGRQSFYSSRNPIIQGHNLYAVDLVRTATGWNNYFGGWKTAGQVNDRIYRSAIGGLDPSGAWSDPQVAINNGVYQHVNDPSVVLSGGVQHMVYTAARTVNHPQFGSFFRDWINYSSSTNGVNWSPASGTTSTEVVLTDPSDVGIGTITSIARPSLVKTDFGWKMWFDGRADNQPDSSFHSYLAHSTGATPTSFELVHRYPDVAGFPGFFEPDIVLRPDGSYFGVVQRNFSDLLQVTSDDGVEFDFDEPFFDGDHPFYPRDHVSNPGLIYDQLADVNYGVGFGMANSGLTDHDIGFAYSQYVVQVRSPAPSSGGQPVWHVLATSDDMVEQQVSVFNYSEFDRVRITDPTTGAILLEQDFTDANQSDVWELRFPPEFPADFDGDSDVDGDDLGQWKGDFGPSGGSDADADGDSDGDDFLIWQQQLGSSAAGAAQAAIPEPTAWPLLAVGVCAICGRCQWTAINIRRLAGDEPLCNCRKKVTPSSTKTATSSTSRSLSPSRRTSAALKSLTGAAQASSPSRPFS